VSYGRWRPRLNAAWSRAPIGADEEDVRRLDVAVHHAVRVCGGERLDRARGDREALGDGERRPREPVGQILAVEPLHREVRFCFVRRAVRHVAPNRPVTELRE
jgi:hypothetical protein